MAGKYTYNPKNRYYGSFVPNWLLERKELTASSKIVWGVLVRHYNTKTGQCDPSIVRLINETGLSSRTVKRSIVELQTFSLIGVTNTGFNARNKYVFFEHLWELPHRRV